MKLRTLTHFEDAVSAETAWRRRELTTLLFNVRDARQSKIQVSLRSGVALLYAHWEGWIKAVGELYVDYVAQQKLPYQELSASFLGTALRVRLNKFEETNAAKLHQEFAAFIQSGGLTTKAQLSSGFIRTESNLSSKVLADITTRLGLPFSPYELLSALIDERLVGTRNRIAHGEYLEVDSAQYEDLHAKVLQMLNQFTDDVMNAASTRSFSQ